LLIMPLHRRMTWANAPLVTLALILVNRFVFFFLQSGDGRILKHAADYYAHSGLGKIEFPAYVDWLREHGGDPKRLKAMRMAPAAVKLAVIESDGKFMAALHADRIITPANSVYADWHARRLQFDGIRDSTFTMRHALRFSHVEPARMLWAMFMHGGLGHLFGNMLFLLILGLLVEGALGARWYLFLYLVGGLGANAVSLAWHWGDQGLALGASGAIAALMGAYCAIWGLRKVRVFYWFFIVFDYVRVPALVLLPFWLGWQLLSLLLQKDAHVGFDAHAGGIVCGALLALALRHFGRVRQDFVDADERAEQHEADGRAYDEAMERLGKLEVRHARALLERIDANEPGQLRVLVALYRCARYDGSPAQVDATVTRVLQHPATTDVEIREIKGVYDDYARACAGMPRLAPEMLLRMVQPWLRIGDDAAAEALLRGIAERTPDLPELAPAWFKLALREPETSPKRRARLEYLEGRFAASEYAAKARFLLQQG
jgi:membrane associated rhomboid family serine protease